MKTLEDTKQIEALNQIIDLLKSLYISDLSLVTEQNVKPQGLANEVQVTLKVIGTKGKPEVI